MEQSLARLSQKVADLFPFWIAAACAAALYHPPVLTWVTAQQASLGLGFTLLVMGSTLRPDEFSAVLLSRPQLVALGLVLQYATTTATGALITRFAGLDVALCTGVALLAGCPAGTACNVITFLARGDVALSVLMTACATLAAALALPLITTLLAGATVSVDASALLRSTLQVVVLPVMMGVLLRHMFPEPVARAAKFAPALAVLIITLTVSSAVAHSAGAITASGTRLLAAVVFFHSAGAAAGYCAARALGLGKRLAKTYAIQVCVRNGVLGTVLAGLHFGDPVVAAPCALSVCVQNILASAVAARLPE